MELTSIRVGLSQRQVLQRRQPIVPAWRSEMRVIGRALLNQCASFFSILLVVAGAFSYVLDNIIDAWIFWGITCLNILVGFIQEYKAARAGKALEQRIQHRITVVREGQHVSIEGTDVVLGDIILFMPGDIIVADVYARKADNAYIDESMRTGESLPRHVSARSLVYAGSSLVSGVLIGQVVNAYQSSSLMQYAKSIDTVAKHNTFTRALTRISTLTCIAAVFCLSIVGVLSLLRSTYTLEEFVLFSISMLIGVVPESLPLIVTLILTQEAVKLSKHGVLVKNIRALQVLGAVRYFITDKTGTLTKNTLNLAHVSDVHNLLYAMSLVASMEHERSPMEMAFDTAVMTYLSKRKISMHSDACKKVHPFSYEKGYAVYEFTNVCIARGKWESILTLCRVHDVQKHEMAALCDRYEQRGLRVIAYATASGSHGSVYHMSGFVAFEDPLKHDAKTSYRALESLGLAMKILTGDSKRVALHIAHKLGITNTQKRMISCEEVDIRACNQQVVLGTSIFAKCTPQQKMDIMNVYLQKGGVGFLGEGMNDALSLKRADVGIVVDNASDVARQAADVLLLEKSLTPVLQAVKMSREAYHRIGLYLTCTLAGNVGTLVSLSIAATLLQQLPMLPIQILLNNVLTDLPLLLLITDYVETSVHKKPIHDRLGQFMYTVLVFAGISSCFDLLYLFFFRSSPIDILRSGWFVFSVLSEIVLVISLRSRQVLWKSHKPSTWLWVALCLCAFIAILLPYISTTQVMFALRPIPPNMFVSIISLLVVYLFINELLKWLFRKTFSLR